MKIIPALSGLTSLSRLLSRRRISVFGHVALLDDDIVPANMAFQLHTNVSLNWPPGCTWRRLPGRPRNKWLDQLRNDSTRPIGDLWRRAIDRGHGCTTTRRPSLATRTWWWWWWWCCVLWLSFSICFIFFAISEIRHYTVRDAMLTCSQKLT